MVGRALDQHAAEAGSFPWCGKELFSQSTFSADSLTVSIHPHAQLHALASVHTLKILETMSEFDGLWKQ